MYDVIIAGAGPAGITAAIYCGRKRLETLVLTKNIGGMAATSADIENYTGYQFITGIELAEKFEEQIKMPHITVKEADEVECIDKDGDIFKVKAKSGQYEAKVVIMTTGRTPRMLGIPGEVEYKNKGVTYCATCDGPLFSGKNVAVIGGGNSAMDAALQLMMICNKVYMVTINDDIEGDEVMKEKLKAAQNVEVIGNAKTKEILGEAFVNKIRIEASDGEKELDVEGVFIEVGSIPVKAPSECEGVELNEWNEIIVNEKCETNIAGLFAAGDVTNIPEKQIIVAAGQGCIAALSAFKYLSKKKFK